jgi:hypothetical protein
MYYLLGDLIFLIRPAYYNNFLKLRLIWGGIVQRPPLEPEAISSHVLNPENVLFRPSAMRATAFLHHLLLLGSTYTRCNKHLLESNNLLSTPLPLWGGGDIFYPSNFKTYQDCVPSNWYSYRPIKPQENKLNSNYFKKNDQQTIFGLWESLYSSLE